MSSVAALSFRYARNAMHEYVYISAQSDHFRGFQKALIVAGV